MNILKKKKYSFFLVDSIDVSTGVEVYGLIAILKH